MSRHPQVNNPSNEDFGTAAASSHYAVGWALAMETRISW